MTIKEAIEILKSRRICAAYVDSEYVDSVDIEAIDMAISALEKQVWKKPFYNGVNCECPFCNTTIETDVKPWYCDICGQRIDWSDEHGTD